MPYAPAQVVGRTGPGNDAAGRDGGGAVQRLVDAGEHRVDADGRPDADTLAGAGQLEPIQRSGVADLRHGSLLPFRT